MRRILCIHLPNWPIQSALGRLAARKAAQVADLPLLLHARDPRRGELVIACNTAAGNCGVRPDMPLAEASTLANRGGKCLVLPHDPAADLVALAQMAEHCERFSPIVGWETVECGMRSAEYGTGQRVRERGEVHPQPDRLFLDVTAIGVLFGGEESLARAVRTDLARLGYEARVGVANTIGAAWAAAVGCMSEANCTSAIFVLSTQDLQFAICNLQFAIPLLRIPPEVLDLLAQLGITQLHQLLALPRSSLRARFGERLLMRIDQLTGAAEETIVAYRPPPKFAAEWLLEYPAENREAIDYLVKQLVERIAQDLAQRREGVVQLACRLDCAVILSAGCARGQPITMEVTLFRPSADPKHLWDLMRMQLEQTALPGSVGRITLQARLTAPLENRQGQLFTGNQDEASRQLGLLIDRLSSRLGPAAVLRPQLTADPLPERAVRYEAGVRNKFKVQGSKFKVQGKRKKTLDLEPETLNFAHSAFHRPLTLVASLPLEVISIVPDGPPLAFRFQGQRHRVARHWGPERIETGWWRGASVRRDYYRVETEEGLRFWIFRRLEDGVWHLHGEFS